MKPLLLLCLIIAVNAIHAQFAVGHQATAFTDVTRNNRSITCEIYYPSNTTGDDVPVANGVFPFVVFGHGFVMDYTAYQNITDVLVAEGFILIYVETEGGFAPVHNEFGLDLAYIADHFMEENSSTSSIFQSHVIDRCAIMGHSMGGGSTWLAAAVSESVDCIVGLAPAETNPSAIEAASSVSVPAMVLSGSADAVTAPATNHTPIYDATTSDCKYFVNILEGSHCGFANSGSLCDFGELLFIGLSREEQQVITHELLLAWFDVYLRDVWTSNEVLQLYDEMQNNTETIIECAVGVEELTNSNWSIYPNPGSELLMVEWESAFHPTSIRLIDAFGKMVLEVKPTDDQHKMTINTAELSSGMYTVQIPEQKGLRWLKL